MSGKVRLVVSGRLAGDVVLFDAPAGTSEVRRDDFELVTAEGRPVNPEEVSVKVVSRDNRVVVTVARNWAGFVLLFR